MAKIKIDRDRRNGMARCQHHECWGNVCSTCFDATPFLIDVYSQVYWMDGGEWVYNKEMVAESKISAATPKVDVLPVSDVRVGDRILGYGSINTTLVVKEIEFAAEFCLRFLNGNGTLVRIADPSVVVVRA